MLPGLHLNSFVSYYLTWANQLYMPEIEEVYVQRVPASFRACVVLTLIRKCTTLTDRVEIDQAVNQCHSDD